ncbi:MAG: PQQ-dependent sugar dehydrogenase, partial [Chitinophagales bacterium]
MNKNSLKYILPIFLMLLGCSSKNTSPAEATPSSVPLQAEILAQDLKVPWGMDILPDGRLLFNEREGNVNILSLETKEIKILLTRDIADRAEGGLLGLAVDPQFESNHYIFIYETAESGNRIVRLIFENEILREDKIIVDGIQKKLFHDGGILKFGPDGYLYAGTGDAREPKSAQDKNNLSGKILRMDRDGNAPADNPFNNLVYSYGHRNVQG